MAQVPGKYLCFLVTRVSERNTIDPEHVMLALTRLRDFMIERRITEVSMPVYDPNRCKLSPREYPTRRLRRNGDNGTSAQEILPEYRLSQVHGGLELGIKRSQVRCWGTEQVKGS